ncbi:TPA: hypothetical protein MX306_004108 [Citrobacter freundii]|nr:hypothetical protein [Citrobacter freundii]
MSEIAQVVTGFYPASPAGDFSEVIVVENILGRWQLCSNLWIVEFDALHEDVCIRDTVAFVTYDKALSFQRGSLVSCAADPDELLI